MPSVPTPGSLGRVPTSVSSISCPLPLRDLVPELRAAAVPCDLDAPSLPRVVDALADDRDRLRDAPIQEDRRRPPRWYPPHAGTIVHRGRCPPRLARRTARRRSSAADGASGGNLIGCAVMSAASEAPAAFRNAAGSGGHALSHAPTRSSCAPSRVLPLLNGESLAIIGPADAGKRTAKAPGWRRA